MSKVELHKTPELLFSCCLLECRNIAYLTTRTLSGETGGDAFRFVQIAEGGDPRCSGVVYVVRAELLDEGWW